MSMGVDVGYGAGIAPHPGPLPNGAREKTSAIFNIEHNRSPRPSGERVRVRGKIQHNANGTALTGNHARFRIKADLFSPQPPGKIFDLAAQSALLHRPRPAFR